MDAEVNRFPHITGLAPQTAKLIDLFKDASIGDSFTDADLSALIGRNTAPGGDGYGNLQSACRYVLRHFGRNIQRVPGSGTMKCLSDSESVVSVERGRQHISRVSRRKAIELRIVDTSKLTQPEKTSALVLRAQLGVLSMYSSIKAAKVLAASDDLDKWQKNQRKMLASM